MDAHTRDITAKAAEACAENGNTGKVVVWRAARCKARLGQWLHALSRLTTVLEWGPDLTWSQLR
jgi:hypothetical protein